MTSQLETDIARRVRERIATVVADGLDLFEMAGIDEEVAQSAVAYELVRAFIARVAVMSDTLPTNGDILRLVAFVLERRRERE